MKAVVFARQLTAIVRRQFTANRPLRFVAVIAAGISLLAACSSQPQQPAPVEHPSQIQWSWQKTAVDMDINAVLDLNFSDG